jgi:hypothetical protein
MHDVLNATPASLSPKPALSSSLSTVASLLPPTHIPILRFPIPGCFLSRIKYTRLGTSYNGFRERLHRNAREIDRRAGCSLGMSVEPTPCHFDECPSGFQSPMYTTIYTTCTSLSAIAHSLLPSLKVTKMSEAFVSKDVYAIYDMMEPIADYLGVKTQQLTRNQSPDAFCLVQSKGDLGANTDRAMAARGSFNGLPYELQCILCDHLNATKNSFSEILTELTPSPVSFSLYYDSPGVLRLAQLDSNLATLHSTVTHFDSAFVAPVHTDPRVTTSTLTTAFDAAESAYHDHDATQKLNEFDLAESKIILRDLMEDLPDLKIDETEKSDIVQGLSASITNSAQTRSSDTNQQDALTDRLQTANGELNIATAAVVECTALIKTTKQDVARYKKACRSSLISSTPLRHAVQTAKHALSTHKERQGKSSVHVPLDERGYGSDCAALRSLLSDHITTVRQERADFLLRSTAVEPTIGFEMLSDQFIRHLAQLAAFDQCFTKILLAAINLPTMDDTSTCVEMRNEVLGERIYNNSNIKGTSFIEKLLDVEFLFSKFITAVNDIFPTPKPQVYHDEIMSWLLPGFPFYVRREHFIYFNEKAVHAVGYWVNKTNINGRTFPVIRFITDVVSKSSIASPGFALMPHASLHTSSVLSPVIDELRAHVNDDFAKLGTDPAVLHKLMNDFYKTMVTQQELALQHNLLLVDSRHPTDKIKSLAAAQNVSSGHGQETSDDNSLPGRTSTQAPDVSTDSSRNKRCKVTILNCIGADHGEIDNSTEMKCPCGEPLPLGFLGTYCSTTCHTRYVTDNPSITVLDEMIRRFQMAIDYQHALACAAADHADANDGTKFIPPAPPQL